MKEKRETEKIIPNYGEPLIFEQQFFLRGLGREFLNHPHFEKYQEFLINKYKPPSGKKILLFTVCAWGKPYSQSYIHYFINRKLYENGLLDKVHKVIVSNSGVIPQEWENFYPFVSYDWDPNFETRKIKELYYNITKERVLKFIKTHLSNYKFWFSYFRPDSESWKSVKDAFQEINLKIDNLAIYPMNEKEKKEISLGGFYKDEDQVLITPRNLNNLITRLKEISRNI